jgi:hypothetical protein
MDTLRDVEVLDGSDTDIEVADHGEGDLEQPPTLSVTERGRRTVENYLGDLQEARSMVFQPPSLKELIRMLWKAPEVLASHWLLKLLVRALYFPIAFPVIFVCYFLIMSFVHPARGTLVGGLLAAATWLWFFS